MIKKFFQHIPIFSSGMIQLELARKKMLLKFLADAMDRDAPLIPLLIAFSEDYKGTWNEKLLELAYLLKNNVALADALQQVGDLVPIGAIPIIRVGAETGQTSETLRMIADTMKTHSEEEQNVNASSITGYTFSIVTTLILITSFIMVYIVPKFKSILRDFDSEGPPIFNLLIYSFNSFVTYSLLILPLMIITYFLMIPVVQNCLVHVSNLRKVRFIGYFTQNLWVPDILRSLSIPAKHQKPLLDSVKIMARHIPNKQIMNKLSNAEIRIQNGKAVWQALADEKIIKRQEMDIFEAAERTGNLPWALQSIASRRDSRSNLRLINFMTFIEPALTLLFGGVVAFIVIGIFSPLVQLINDFS